MASWQISGEYMETCNCTLLCPCIISNLAAGVSGPSAPLSDGAAAGSQP